MNRRNLLKPGFTLAGSSLLLSQSKASNILQVDKDAEKIEIKEEPLPKFVLDFSDVEAPKKIKNNRNEKYFCSAGNLHTVYFMRLLQCTTDITKKNTDRVFITNK